MSLTGINRAQLRELIEDVLKEIGLYSKEAVEIVHGTIAYESANAHYIEQVNGPAQGIGQIEPFTERDLWNTYLRYKPELALKIILVSSPFRIKIPFVTRILSNSSAVFKYLLRRIDINENALRGNLIYSICMVRVKYLRDPHKLPTDLRGQAALYKRWYNTPEGRGTEAGYIQAFNEYVA